MSSGMNICAILDLDCLVLRLYKTPELIFQVILRDEHVPDAVDGWVLSIVSFR